MSASWHDMHSPPIFYISLLAITILWLQDSGKQRISLGTVALHWFFPLLCNPTFNKKQTNKQKTLKSNQKFTLDYLFLLQALLLGRSFFTAYRNSLALIWSWFLSHSLTKVLKKGIHRNSGSAINDIFTNVKEYDNGLQTKFFN